MREGGQASIAFLNYRLGQGLTSNIHGFAILVRSEIRYRLADFDKIAQLEQPLFKLVLQFC